MTLDKMWHDLHVMTGTLSVAGSLALCHCSPVSRHAVQQDILHQDSHSRTVGIMPYFSGDLHLKSSM